MRVPLFLVLFLPILIYSMVPMDWGMCGTDGIELQKCIFHLFDNNNDDAIDWAEVVETIPTLLPLSQQVLGMNRPGGLTEEDPTLNATLTAYMYFVTCDINQDGKITMEDDFSPHNKTCLRYPIQTMCVHCMMNGYYPPLVQAEMEAASQNKRNYEKRKKK